MSEARYERARDLLEAELGDELVALDPAGGNCFGFNGVAASVWRQLDQPKSLAELSDALADEYEVGREECAADLKALLDELSELGLVRRSG